MDDGNNRKPTLTVVGGQPNKPRGAHAKGTIKVPVGFEKLLYHAARDEGFRKRLLNDREAAIQETRVRLRPSETAMLRVLSDNALEAMIANLVPENPRRRKFMGLVAAAAASLAAGTAGCDDATYEAREAGVDAGVGPDIYFTDSSSDEAQENDSDTAETDQPSSDTPAGIVPDTAADSDTITSTDSDSASHPDSNTDTASQVANTGSETDTESDAIETDQPSSDTPAGIVPDTAVDSDMITSTDSSSESSSDSYRDTTSQVVDAGTETDTESDTVETDQPSSDAPAGIVPDTSIDSDTIETDRPTDATRGIGPDQTVDGEVPFK